MKADYLGISLCISVILACNKPEAVLFNDNSTAIKADKSTWTATADSETPDGWENTGKASALLDGNMATYWHTDYSVSPTPGYPHWVLIDMKTEQQMISVAVTNRQAATPNRVGMKKFRLEGSRDGQAFTSLGEFDFAITNAAQTYPLSPKEGWRYLKLTALESQTGTTAHTFLAEIDVFTKK
jgi:hypothetical protein